MINSVTLEQVIRDHIRLGKPSSKGWYPVACKVCNDHGKKGDRGAFKFEGRTVGYHCFNCDHRALYDPDEYAAPSEKMVTVLTAFGIDRSDWESIILSALIADGKPSERQAAYQDITPKEIQFPASFYQLTNDPDDEWAQCAIDYLTVDRLIDWKSYPFYLSKHTDDKESIKWFGRLIIPVYKDGKLIFWQGRDLTDMLMKKYLSCHYPKDNVLSGFDKLRLHTTDPIYITEGWFDAHPLNGVAVFGNVLTPGQIKWINQSSRPKVVIPDKFGDGHLMAKQALELGWSISLPDIGQEKDVNSAIKKYGQLYTLSTIKEQTCSGTTAMIRLAMYCETKSTKHEKKNT